jgi:hypothetical protein
MNALKNRTTQISAWSLMALASAAALMAPTAPAKAEKAKAAPAEAPTINTPLFGREPWPAQRTVLLLPLQFGPGWNLDKERAAMIMPEAEQKLQVALQRTGKFSTTQLHRYNPIFLRAVQDKLLTKEQVDAMIAAPTVQNVQEALSKINFRQAPLIAEFAMEEITTEAGAPVPNVRAQVTGKLYEATDGVAIKTVVVTSDPQPLHYTRKKGKNTVYVRRSSSERVLAAANNAFDQIATEFVKPLDDITLPEPVVPEGMVVTGTVTPGAVTPGGQTVITVPKGQVLGTFNVPPKK